MPYVVYILQDEQKRLYKGVTNNLDRRLREHKAGKTRTTARMGKQLMVVYTETFNVFDKARAREVYFKTSAGRKFLKNILT